MIALFPIVLPRDGPVPGSFAGVDVFGPAEFETRPITIEFEFTVTSPGRIEIYGKEFLTPPSDQTIFDTFAPPEDQVVGQDPVLESELFLTESDTELRDERLKKISKMEFIERRVVERSFALFLREGLDGSESFTITPGSISSTVGAPVPEPTTLGLWLAASGLCCWLRRFVPC